MGFVIIEHKSAPTSNVFDFASIDFSPYKFCILELQGLVFDTDAVNATLQVRQSGSVLSAANSYAFYMYGLRSNSTVFLTERSAAAAAAIAISEPATAIGNDSGETYSARIEIFNMAAGLKTGLLINAQYVNSAGNIFSAQGSAHVTNTTAIDGLYVAGVGGLITSGLATLIGYR